jgi:hypothetical protein
MCSLQLRTWKQRNDKTSKSERGSTSTKHGLLFKKQKKLRLSNKGYQVIPKALMVKFLQQYID